MQQAQRRTRRMLAFGNKEFRNLQEQVLKNMDDIKSIKEGSYVLDEFGIKVIGQVPTEDDLPGGQDFEYGDAFAVGTETPYELWIWTRTDEQGLIGYWLDIGAFPVPGPQGETGETGATGPQGPQGEKGDKGDKGDTGEQGPQGAKGDKGDTGATGAQGPKGDTGTTYTILGQVDDESDLPNPSLVDRHGAYLVGTVEPYELYVVSGDSNNLEWLDAGVIAIGPAGPQGPAGPKGDTGATGAQGPQGETGAQGPKGDTGDPVTITVNGTTYTQSGGNITLPNYPNGGVWGNITGTLSNQTDLQDALDDKQDVISDLASIRTGAGKGNTAVQPADLATVATTGDYDDLIDKPTIPSATSQLTNDSGFITNAALSGYALSSEIPTAVSELTNDSDYATETYVDNAIAGLGNVFEIKGSVATVSDLPASGNEIGDVYYVASEQAGYVWIEINNVPQWEELGPSIDLSGYAETADLATVAFSGSYNDLSNKPTIPAAQVNADWNASSGVAQILNKPTIPTNYITTDTDQLTLSGQKKWSYTYEGTTEDVERTITLYAQNGSLTNVQKVKDKQGNTLSSDSIGFYPAALTIISSINSVPITQTNYKKDKIEYSYTENGNSLATTFNFPKKTGSQTLACLSDITAPTNVVTTDTVQTITAQKTIDGLYSDDGDTPFTPLKLKYDSNEVHFLEVYDYEENCTVSFDSLATTNRHITFPDNDGTVALVSNIPNVSNMMTTNTAQTVSARKEFITTAGANSEYEMTLDTGVYNSSRDEITNKFEIDRTDPSTNYTDMIGITMQSRGLTGNNKYAMDISYYGEGTDGSMLYYGINISKTGLELSKYSYDANTQDEVDEKVNFDDLKATVDTVSSQTTETWTFTVDDGQGGTTTVTKTVVLG